MESVIMDLDHRTDPATKQMLSNVVLRKRKFERNKKRHILSVLTALTVALLMIIYVYKTVGIMYSYSFFAMFSAFITDPNNFLLFLLTGGLFGLMNVCKEKREKAEKEYHALRCEIIDRSKDLWKQEEEWKNRHRVFEIMKEHFDINLYHESK